MGIVLGVVVALTIVCYTQDPNEGREPSLHHGGNKA
jgi:hypothetical protein